MGPFVAATIPPQPPPQAQIWKANMEEARFRDYLRLAYIFEKAGRLSDAQKVYFIALRDNPNFIEFQFGAPLIVDAMRERFASTQWDGKSSLEGKTLLIYAEKGLGDTIQFCRFLSALKGRGARLLFKAQTPLYEMLKLADLGVELIDPATDLDSLSFDLSTGLLALPALLEINAGDLPGRAGYLRVDDESIARVAGAFSPQKLRVGLVWSGDKSHPHNPDRSIPIGELISAFRDWPQIELYSLQIGEASGDLSHLIGGPHVTDLAPLVRSGTSSYLDTLALIASLDLLVTVDTSVCHAASALIPELRPAIFILLPARPDLRWSGKGEHSLWYDGPLLLRQEKRGEWQSVIQELQMRLSNFNY